MSKMKTTTVSVLMALFTFTGYAGAASNPPESCTIAGPDDAPLVIEEYADFYCHFCQMGAGMVKEILKDYPDKVKLVFRNMPLQFHGAEAMTAAQAFAAVWLQNHSLANSYQEQLFEHQDELIKNGDNFLYDTAARLGVNVTQMKTDMQGATVAAMIVADQKDAEAHGFGGTPSFRIGCKSVKGARPYSEIKAIIEKQLHKSGSNC